MLNTQFDPQFHWNLSEFIVQDEMHYKIILYRIVLQNNKQIRLTITSTFPLEWSIINEEGMILFET